MKFNHNFAIAIIFLLLIFSVGCNIMGHNHLSQIEGIWIKDDSIESDQNLTQRLEYTFNSDNTFEAVRIVIESISENIVGYRHARYGVFTVNGNQLTMVTTQKFTMDQRPEQLYVSRDALKASEDSEESVTVKFDIKNNKMTWKYPPCPPNVNCTGSQMFFRKN